jgi:hypothetical protein
MARNSNRHLPAVILCWFALAGNAEDRTEKTVPALAAPSYFASGESNPDLLEQIREGIDNKITFAGHYSMVFVPCGTACGSYWFIDRRNGAVIAAPDRSGDGQMLSDVKTSVGSNLVEVIYGPPGGFEEPGCSKQSFRWTDHEFEEATPSIPIKCPW